MSEQYDGIAGQPPLGREPISKPIGFWDRRWLVQHSRHGVIVAERKTDRSGFRSWLSWHCLCGKHRHQRKPKPLPDRWAHEHPTR